MLEDRGAAVNTFSELKGAYFLLNKKEALSGLIQVNDDKEMNGGEVGLYV